ncbi:bifunctional adenosylcobinamide kinase/adenosylcobinamide-phosphate guanylyltransferase [Spirulina subsalsa FACHB-351]|uniref:Adenosylcobinamide kinase n=1 Tax=Spirulina subsalsa FACHB-351 TaxID=234711 RepID=A0ABT3L1D7_9CYAN|nr:bifunctional adenosylcobinamide kinase/adenosylcobinamide-phosphate guanylyltransferase [Spirulina subsalsa]MCW6035313.1 bifunctional adenosylcobinamide kinase/adenosylcobinamide-phosphate guanylyltransferase [Spirulina subsalsa FACHB-351]
MLHSPTIILVTGPASSGKSEWAEYLAMQSGKRVSYLATARLNLEDPEWQAKIAKHQARRPPDWQMLWVPEELTATLAQNRAEDCFLVDALGTWVANGLEWPEEEWQDRVRDLLQLLPTLPGVVILVGEETGWGLVPVYPLGRQFRDRLGSLLRYIGAMASTVYLVTGGYALDLTQLGIPLPKNP